MTAHAHDVATILEDYVSELTAKSIIAAASRWSKVKLERLRPGEGAHFLSEIEKGVRLYVKRPQQRQDCMQRLSRLLGTDDGGSVSAREARIIEIGEESDIVMARGAARSIAIELGFPATIQIKIATAVSELARNIVQYAGYGKVTLTPIQTPTRKGIEVVATDDGPGIEDKSVILSGRYQSKTGLGIGLRGTRSLMDVFEIQSAPNRGTTVRIRKYVQ